jgi:rhamnosyltransferase
MKYLPTRKIKVSVVVPTKNPGLFFQKIINIILKQNTNWPFEVFVVDSGSLDGTIEFLKKTKKNFSNFNFIQIENSRFGHGKTRNLAISRTKGEFIALLTQDAQPSSLYWLAELVNCINLNPRIAGVFGRHLAYDNASPFTKWEINQHFEQFVNSKIVYIDDKSRYQIDETYRNFLCFFSNNNSLIRRSVWNKIPFPTVNFAEDQAWAKLILEGGYYKAFSNKAIVYHSHNYKLHERLQRSFDETLALQVIFKSNDKVTLTRLCFQFLRMTKRDLKLILENNLFKENIKSCLLMPFDNMMRLLGQYLATKKLFQSKIFINILSRDLKIKNNT